MKKKLMIILIIILALIVFLVAGIIIWYNNSISGNKNNSEPIIVEIGEGANLNSVGNLLEEKGIINNTMAFRIYIKLNNKNNLIAGKYCFSPSMSFDEITRILEKGEVYKGDEIKLTYIDGNCEAKII